VDKTGQCVRKGLVFAIIALTLAAAPLKSFAAPFAAMVMDARSGEVIYSRNADTRLHPASLTKMMTLYIAFEAVEHGEISLDTEVTISRNAASEPPSKLGLRPGQKIRLRYLIRAAAVKSANDAATAIGEAIEGSEEAFARRMNRTARAMGMTRTTFKNMHGLTEAGHLSTARDMTVLGRHVFYDYPDYYNLFSRITADAGTRTVYHTNRRFLRSYRGADGIKTGYTSASGFNLVASAERGGERIITTVFGGASTAARNAKVAELMDLGFGKAPRRVAIRRPQKPPYMGHADDGRVGKAVRVSTLIGRSPLPRARPVADPPKELLLAIEGGIAEAVDEIAATPVAEGSSDGTLPALPLQEVPVPQPRPAELTLAALEPAGAEQPQIVTRMSSSGGRQWGINVGRYGSRYQAEKVLLQTALKELGTLDDALRKVKQGNLGFDANFVGMTEQEAALACRRLSARGAECTPFGPS